MSHWTEELHVTVEEWSDDGNRLIEVMARCSNGVLAKGAYFAARGLRPKARIMVRDGARVVMDSADQSSSRTFLPKS